MHPTSSSIIYREKARMMGRGELSPRPKPPARPPKPICMHVSTIPDGWIEIQAGERTYLTQRKTLSQKASVLQHVFVEPQIHGAHLSLDGKRLTLDSDGPTFRFILHFLRCSRLPAGLNGQEYSMLRQEADVFNFSELAEELDLFYPLREVARKHKHKDLHEHLIWTLHLCASFVAAGRDQAALHKLEKYLARWPLDRSQALAAYAAQHKDGQVSALIFAFLTLHLKPQSTYISYLRSLATRGHMTFFTRGTEGFLLARAGAIEISNSFLKRAKDFTGGEGVDYLLQKARIDAARTQDWIQAEFEARQLTLSHANNAAVHCFLGECLIWLNRLDEAESALSHAKDICTTGTLDPSIYSHLATCYLNANRLRDAIRSYNISFALGGDGSSIARTLGHIYSQLGEYVSAESWYRTYLNTALLDPLAYYYVAQVLISKQQFEQAIAMIDMGLNVDSKSLILHQTLAHALIYKDDLEGAIEACKKVVELYPNDCYSLCQLGELQLLALQDQEALNTYTQACNLFPQELAAMAGKQQAQNNLIQLAQAGEDGRIPTFISQPTFSAVPLDGVL